MLIIFSRLFFALKLDSTLLGLAAWLFLAATEPVSCYFLFPPPSPPCLTWTDPPIRTLYPGPMLTVQPGSRQRLEPLQRCSRSRYTTFRARRTVRSGEASSCKLYERYGTEKKAFLLMYVQGDRPPSLRGQSSGSSVAVLLNHSFVDKLSPAITLNLSLFTLCRTEKCSRSVFFLSLLITCPGTKGSKKKEKKKESVQCC